MIIKTSSPSTMSFLTVLIISTFIIMSSSNWIILWLSIEVNLMSIIPLILTTNKNNELEAATKYFLVQATGSIILLISVFISNISIFLKKLSIIIFLSRILLKIGIVPFHLWFPQVLANISWLIILLISTWQKLGPLLILRYGRHSWSYVTIRAIAIANRIIGRWGGIRQTQLQPLISYSSISHIGWIIRSLIWSPNLSIIYLILYSIITSIIILPFIIHDRSSSSKRNSSKSLPHLIKPLTAMNLLSIGGIPPLLGFLPKWIVISLLVKISPILILLLLLFSLVRLFFYIKIIIRISTNRFKNNTLTPKTKVISIIFPQVATLLVTITSLSYDK